MKMVTVRMFAGFERAGIGERGGSWRSVPERGAARRRWAGPSRCSPDRRLRPNTGTTGDSTGSRPISAVFDAARQKQRHCRHGQERLHAGSSERAALARRGQPWRRPWGPFSLRMTLAWRESLQLHQDGGRRDRRAVRRRRSADRVGAHAAIDVGPGLPAPAPGNRSRRCSHSSYSAPRFGLERGDAAPRLSDWSVFSSMPLERVASGPRAAFGDIGAESRLMSR